jgi:hypothetical protein
MYKERIQNIFLELYINNKISSDKFLSLSKKLTKVSEGTALDLLIEGPFSGISTFLKKSLDKALLSKPAVAVYKATGVTKLKDLTNLIQTQKDILNSSVKGSTEWNNAKKLLFNLQAKRAGLLGLQGSAVSSTAYGLKKLATRGYDQKEIRNAYNRNRYK